MAEFKEVMKNKNRMCDALRCYDCLLSSDNNGSGVACDTFANCHPEEAQEIIMKWAEEHPIKTNADKFKEVMSKTFGLDVSEMNIEMIDCTYIKCNGRKCEDCRDRDF